MTNATLVTAVPSNAIIDTIVALPGQQNAAPTLDEARLERSLKLVELQEATLTRRLESIYEAVAFTSDYVEQAHDALWIVSDEHDMARRTTEFQVQWHRLQQFRLAMLTSRTEAEQDQLMDEFAEEIKAQPYITM